MATFTKFNSFVEALAEKTHNLGSDTLKLALTNSAPTSSNTVLADITQVSYTYKLVIADTTLTSTGGGTGPFRYVVIYNDTATNDELIAYYDYGSNLTLNSGDSLAIDFDGSGGLLTIA